MLMPSHVGGQCGTFFVTLVFLLLPGVRAVQAGELQVIAGGGITAPLTEIIAQFERASGHKVNVRYGTAPQLIKMAMGDGPIDLAVVPQDVLKDRGARARFTAEAPQDVARVGIGVAVRKGAPRPDISTPAALKQTLLEATSIASIPASATGTQLAGIYERLGITAEMKSRTKAQPLPAKVVEAVANGDAQLAIFGVNILMDPRLDLVGPLPAELQREVVYAAAIALSSKEPDAAMAFLNYLLSAPAASVFKARGMSPG
jgi:molybdate transport system substrate-binding protein